MIATKLLFVKGQRPPNHSPVGSIKIRNRNARPTVWIKVSEPDKWEMLKRYNWKFFYGDIPEGMMVTHKDGNTLNCDPENLRLITRAENIIRNNTF
jgi:hypothetical protein